MLLSSVKLIGRLLLSRVLSTLHRCSISKLHAFLFLFFSGSVAISQVNPGRPSLSAFDNGQYDTIDLQNLNVMLNVPVVSKPGAIPFSYSLNGGYYIHTVQGANGLQLTASTGLVGSAGILTRVDSTTQTAATCPNGTATTEYSNWNVLGSDGTFHPLPPADYTDSQGCLNAAFTAVTIDGSGYTITSTKGILTSIYDKSGNNLLKGITDPSGNSILPMNTVNASNAFTDTLGLTALTASVPNGGLSDTYSWVDVSGSTATTTLVSTAQELYTSFRCPNYTDVFSYSVNLNTAVDFPDGTSLGLQYEGTNSYPGDVTGRLSLLTLRDGKSTVAFNYNPSNLGPTGNDGLNCTYLVPKQLTRTTGDGTESYSLAFFLISGANYGETDTKIDIGKNKTVYTFTGFAANGNDTWPVSQALTEVQYYANIGTMSSPSYSSTPTRQIVYCYNGVTSGCSTAVVSQPITERDTYTTLGGMSTSARTQTIYDNYGNVSSSAAWDFGATYYATKVSTTYGSWNGTSCIAVGNNIHDRPCDVQTTSEDSSGVSSVIAESRYSYEARGKVLTTYEWTGSQWLSNSTPNVYNSSNGTASIVYDLANVPTTYGYNSSSYSSCSGSAGTCTNYPFSTSVSKGGLTAYSTWSGTGGVKLTNTDASGGITTYGYSDPWNRVTSIQDPLGNIVQRAYSATSVTSSFAFGSSVNNTTTTLDGYGRPINGQAQQGPSSNNFDTVSTAYNFSSVNPSVYASMPCTTTGGASCGGSTGVTKTLDMLGRPLSVVDSGGGTMTNTYTQNDMLSVLGPPPSGENAKQTQTEYDGLGRLKSSCNISSTVSGNTPCLQNNGSYRGVLTTASYSSASGSQTIKYVRGVQTRSRTYDGLGRVTSDTTPEAGTTTSFYDSATSCGMALSSPGRLVYTKFSNGNTTCYQYDSLGRPAVITGATSSGQLSCRRFYYDNSKGALGAIPSGVTVLNPNGRLVEAETDTCVSPITTSSMITDEWFSYDAGGRQADAWEKTPKSGMYYHSHATFAGNGALLTLQLANPSLYTETYALDGEGRWNSLISGSETIVSGTTYNAASQPTYIDVGTGTDQSDYVYDPNTGRMKSWAFYVGSSQSEKGTLTWNPNSTLQSLSIVDGFNAAGSQSCDYNSSLAAGTGYDDLGRLVGVTCGSTWAQTFSYDEYDNLTKSGSISWNPGYYAASNHYASGATYDARGNLTNDLIHTYTWNQFNKLQSIDSSSCATNGECITYDAFGRIVETSYNGTYQEVWYTQLGKAVYMVNGSTPYYAYWPTPGGGTVEVNGNAVTSYYMHKDWLGSARISQTIINHTVESDQAYAPYGEVYNKVATGAGVPAQMYTGDTQDVIGGIFDTPNRELNVSQGRWISPDPAGTGWNQYVYGGNNPTSFSDPLGLCPGCDDPHYQRLDALGSQGGDCFGDPNCAIWIVNGVQVPSSVGMNVLALVGEGSGGSPGQFGTFIQTTHTGSIINYGDGMTQTTAGTDTVYVTLYAIPTAANSWVSLYPPGIFTRANNTRVVQQWRPQTDVVRAPYQPLPYKPSVAECFTNPGNAVELMAEASGTQLNPEEHDPSAPALIYHNGTIMGSQSLNTEEAEATGNGLAILSAGAAHWVGCMLGALFGN
jgi:RHS repeat-associated protein